MLPLRDTSFLVQVVLVLFLVARWLFSILNELIGRCMFQFVLIDGGHDLLLHLGLGFLPPTVDALGCRLLVHDVTRSTVGCSDLPKPSALGVVRPAGPRRGATCACATGRALPLGLSKSLLLRGAPLLQVVVQEALSPVVFVSVTVLLWIGIRGQPHQPIVFELSGDIGFFIQCVPSMFALWVLSAP
ncbi:hypothetical protein MFUL124B02_05385 [Myxococcus fulvus 124B02]|nr:hypothetical protein MFUL124B02_05385 [Myxococcus fulvus 124B02]